MRGASPRFRFGLALASAVLLVHLPGVQAEEYTSPASHYRFTVPNDWTRTTFPGVDVGYVSPGGAANLNVVVVVDRAARNSGAWLLASAEVGLDAVVGGLPDATVLQEPRAFTSGTRRPAVDYVFEYRPTSASVWLRLRQVLFASDAWDLDYVLTLAAVREEYDSLQPVWTEAVATFDITDEGSAGSGLGLLLVVVTAGAVIAAALLAVLLRRRRRRLAPPVRETPPPAEGPAVPQPSTEGPAGPPPPTGEITGPPPPPA